ncbi:sensor histidine kinase [Rubellimicrobium roseum]|nr:PAS domain-containing protein [Rubellimicrobium roseum]
MRSLTRDLASSSDRPPQAQGLTLLGYAAAVVLPVLTLLLPFAAEAGPAFAAFLPAVAVLAALVGTTSALLGAALSAVLAVAWHPAPALFGPGSGPLWTGLAVHAAACAVLVLAARHAGRAAAQEAELRTRIEAEAATVRGAADRRLEVVTDALPVFISEVGRDLRYRFVNRAYEEAFGRRRDDIKGRFLPEVIGPEAFADAQPHIEAVLAGRSTSYESQVPHAGGELHDFRAHYVPHLDRDGQVAGFFALVQDITESRRQADLLVQRERHLRAVLDSVSDCFYAVDRNWRITVFNRAAERYFGRRRDEVLGLVIWEAFPAHVGSIFDQNQQRVMATGVPVTFEAPSVSFPDRVIEMRVAPKEGSGLAVAFSDITCRKAEERQRELLIHELNHRVKNTLAVVQSIASQSLRGPDVPANARAAFEGRLLALAGAHDLLTRESWEAARLQSLVETALDPFDRLGRFDLSGPDLRLRPQAAVNLTLALHELATNATKYGSLASPAGRVSLGWTVSAGSEPLFRLSWEERGGTAVAPPARTGFGSRLIQRGLSAELGGPVLLDFRAGGLVCTIEAPLANLQPA